MKKLSLLLCSAVVLCFFNLAALQAEDPINDNTQEEATVSIYVVIYVSPIAWYIYRTPYQSLSFIFGSLSDDSDDINKQEATPASSPSTAEN